MSAAPLAPARALRPRPKKRAVHHLPACVLCHKPLSRRHPFSGESMVGYGYLAYHPDCLRVVINLRRAIRSGKSLEIISA